MSTRIFCDCCGAEITPYQNAAVTPIANIAGGVTIKISAGFNGLNQGEICRNCVFDAVQRLDSRPRETTQP